MLGRMDEWKNRGQRSPRLNPLRGAPDGAPGEIFSEFHGEKIQQGGRKADDGGGMFDCERTNVKRVAGM